MFDQTFLSNLAWLNGFGVVGLGVGFLLGRYGITGIWTEITTLKNDVANLKVQSPVTVTPTPAKVIPVAPAQAVTHPTPAASPVFPHPVGQVATVTPVVAPV